MVSLLKTPIRYVEAANGVRFAYRKLGQQNNIPLVMHIHFRANMDFWDPALIKGLLAVRPVILFDQAGVGRSTGEVPRTYQGWADDVIAFVTALELERIDLLGFSMGGAAVQMVALTAPLLVRKLVLCGTTASQPSNPSNLGGIVWPRELPPPEPIRVLATAVGTDPAQVENALAVSFFPTTDEGGAASRAYWSRISSGPSFDEPSLLQFLEGEPVQRQLAAYRDDWDVPRAQNSFDRLGELSMPVLVLNGDNDVLIPTSRSWEMLVKIPNAQLIIYPGSGHGFLYQHAQRVAEHINMFLEADDGDCAIAEGSKL